MDSQTVVSEKFKTKTPKILLLLSFCFLFAPLGNFGFTFYSLALPNWYYPTEFFNLLKNVTLFDWTWNLATFISGLLLLFRRKIAWLAAILSILLAAFINIYRHIFSPVPELGGNFLAITLGSSLAGLLMILYFRFPYLDRRDRWWNVHHRKKCNLIGSSTLSGFEKLHVTNISKSGAFAALAKMTEQEIASLSAAEKSLRPFQISLPLESMTPLTCEAEIVSIRAQGFGLRFKNLTSEQKLSLTKFLSSLT